MQGRTAVRPNMVIGRQVAAIYLIIYAICMDAPRCVHISFLYLIIYADTCIDDAPGCVPTVCPIRDGKRVAEATVGNMQGRRVSSSDGESIS